MPTFVKNLIYSGQNNNLEDCFLSEKNEHQDSRGSFKNVFPEKYPKKFFDYTIVQVNLSYNRDAGTIRGLHFQKSPFLEFKTVTCLAGRLIDVLLDLRTDSKTYGRLAFYYLSPDTGSLHIPPLVAHGFQTLDDHTSLLYLHSNEHSPTYSMGINPFDPELSIRWPLPVTQISDSDKNLPFFSKLNN